MSLRRALQSSLSAVPTVVEAGPRAAIDTKPWSRRGWPREQLRAHWPHLTIQQVELLKEVFQLFDTEDKGYFTKDDLFFVMEAMGGSPTPQELDAVMYELDSNGDSVVDFPEFLTKFLTATDEKELLSVFHQLAIQEGEGNDDRVLTLTAVERSFQYVGERLTDEDRRYLEIIFRGADKDGNGRLDIKEFTAYLEKMDDELFLGQTGALGSLLAAANNNGGVAAAKGFRRGGGSASAFGSRRRSGGEDGDLGGVGAAAAADGGGSGAAAEEANGSAARLTHGQLLAMATRALSSRGAAAGLKFGGGGGAGDDLESVSSNQGGLRHSFLSKLTRARRHRRSSVNSSTIAALAGQLASMGVNSGGRAVRVGSIGSNACMAAASLLHQEASEGLRSASSARTAMQTHVGGVPAGGPAVPPGGVAAHFIVETSSVSALRLVSSTGQMPGLWLPDDRSTRPMAPATAPVALSRAGSFGDGSGRRPGQQAGEQVAVPGLGPHHHPHAHQHQYPGWGPGIAATTPGPSHHVFSGGGGGGGGLGAGGWHPPPQPMAQHQHQHQHQSHQHPNRGINQQSAQPLAFQKLRSRSMPSAVAGVPPPGSLAPLAIPASLQDSEDFLSGSVSPFSPASGSGGGAAGPGAATAAAGGTGSQPERSVHAGYGGRTPGSGLRSPAASWQKASVIQEAPEEGDSGYVGAGAASALGPAYGQLEHRLDYHGGRTSAPTRLGRLVSFPARLPPQADVTSGSAAATTAAAAAGTATTDGDGGGGMVFGGGDARSSGGGAAPLTRPTRLGSGGDGRLSHRISGLMAAVFSRQWSLGYGAAAAPAPAAAEGHSVADAHASRRATEPGERSSPASRSQLPLHRGSFAAASARDRSSHGSAAAPTPAPSSWGFAASARAAIGWLRRASSLGHYRGGSGGGAATSSGGGVGDAGRGNPPALAPPPAPLAASGSSRVPPWRLTVRLPDSDSAGSSKLTSPADVEASPGPSAGTSSLMSPGPGYFASPFTSPVAAAAAAAAATSSGPASPSSALLPRQTAAVALAAPAATGSPDSGPPTPGSAGAEPLTAASRGGSGRASPSSAHAAALHPQLRQSASPYSRTSAPGASPLAVKQPHQDQQSHHLTPPRLPPPEPAVSPAPAAPTPPAWLQPPPRPVVPSVIAVSPRLAGAALGVPGARSLNRSGSVGGSSRLAVSTARDSPPVVPRHMHRQQSLQLHHQPYNPNHPSPLVAAQQQQQLAPPPPPSSHRLSQQGLPGQFPIFPYSPTPYPYTPHGSGQQSPHESDPEQPEHQPPQPSPLAQPHRLGQGLPHGGPQYHPNYPPSQQPQPPHLQSQQRYGDWAAYNLSGSSVHRYRPQQQQPQQHGRSGPGSASSSAGGPGSPGQPSSSRVSAYAGAAVAGSTAASSALSSPWGTVCAASFATTQQEQRADRPAVKSAGAPLGAGADAGAGGEVPRRQPGRRNGAQAGHSELGGHGCYPPPRAPPQLALVSGLRKEVSERLLGGSSPLGRSYQQQRQEQQQSHRQQAVHCLKFQAQDRPQRVQQQTRRHLYIEQQQQAGEEDQNQEISRRREQGLGHEQQPQEKLYHDHDDTHTWAFGVPEPSPSRGHPPSPNLSPTREHPIDTDADTCPAGPMGGPFGSTSQQHQQQKQSLRPIRPGRYAPPHPHAAASDSGSPL